jgi:hypothetical protein
MNIFEDLAIRVDNKWSQTGYQLASFQEIATQSLETFSYELTKDQLDLTLAEWFLKTAPLPPQINLHNTFGQPPITIFNNHKFVVDLYIWLDFDTSIHSHGFRGAFRVLHGKSLHEKFKVKNLKTFSPDVMLTELGTPEMTLLQRGDIHSILPGKELIHRVVHLESPTITLCVKTINEPELFQWNYFPNGLAIQKRHLPASLIKEIYYFQYLLVQNPTLATDFLNQILDRSDISTHMNLSEEIMSGAYALSEETSELILGRILERHGETEWFQRYEDLNLLAQNELHFEHYDSALQRLLAHFINCGYGLKAATSFLSQLAERDLPSMEIQSMVKSLAQDERLYGIELQQAGQIKKILDFKNSDLY